MSNQLGDKRGFDLGAWYEIIDTKEKFEVLDAPAGYMRAKWLNGPNKGDAFDLGPVVQGRKYRRIKSPGDD